MNAIAVLRGPWPNPKSEPPGGLTWVSKTDLTKYLRCPYAFYLLDRGLVRFEDTVTEQQVRLIEEGVAFHAGVEAVAVARIVEPGELRSVFARESIRLFRVPLLKNHSLKIIGMPDAIDTAQGALFPVEIKSHKDVQPSDELQLAFYWLLLEAYRTKRASPVGYLLLRRNGVVEQVEVEIQTQRLERVHELLQEIRDARDMGVRPRICGCTVCSGVMRDEILRVTRDNKDLTLIWDIGKVRARRLEQIGISTYDHLLATDSVAIVEAFREERRYVSAAQVDRWKHHARSYSTARPVLFGDRPALNGSFLALDLEYGPLIWLVGVCVVKSGCPEYLVLWADTPAQEKANLERLAEFAATNSSLPVVTWAGNGADMPQLRCAAQRLELGKTLAIIESRHLDLFQHVARSMRLPMPQLALRELATYFGIPKVSRIRNGLEAQSRYQEYRSCADRDARVALKTDLIEYNREDLEALVGVADRIVAFWGPP